MFRHTLNVAYYLRATKNKIILNSLLDVLTFIFLCKVKLVQ